ncbi:MAG TPA: cupin domain-containing protein [Pyrinomonadaceae bacterium]|nr:cupin domain-containing protein [Pyrinomonadaceae bacterium]
MKRILIVATVLTAVVALGLGQEATKTADHGLFTPGDIKWMDVPNALPAGAKLAVLEGNPFNPGLYTMRLSMPAGYRIPPHWHAKVEHVTVISGKFNLGMGEKFDQSKGNAMPAGTFGFLPPQMKHFAWASEETVIQLHGEGPWEINYVNPSDDPRKKGE